MCAHACAYKMRVDLLCLRISYSICVFTKTKQRIGETKYKASQQASMLNIDINISRFFICHCSFQRSFVCLFVACLLACLLLLTQRPNPAHHSLLCVAMIRLHSNACVLTERATVTQSERAEKSRSMHFAYTRVWVCLFLCVIFLLLRSLFASMCLQICKHRNETKYWNVLSMADYRLLKKLLYIYRVARLTLLPHSHSDISACVFFVHFSSFPLLLFLRHTFCFYRHRQREKLLIFFYVNLF